MDDEPVLNLTFAVLLRQAGATVWQAANGEEALAVMRREAVDLILCDQAMPVMNGPAFLQALHNERKSVPTLLFSSTTSPEDAAALARWRVYGLLPKPISPLHLLSAVDQALSATRSELNPWPLTAG